MTIRLTPPPDVRWRYAIAEHERGDPARLVALLHAGGELPPVARAYLARLATATAKRPRGRPARAPTIAAAWQDFKLLAQYRRLLAAATLDEKAPGTPSERALELLAERHGTSTRTIERRLQKLLADQ